MFHGYAETKLAALEARVKALEKENDELRQNFVIPAYTAKFEHVAERSMTEDEIREAQGLSVYDLQSAMDRLDIEKPPEAPPQEIYPIGV